MVEGLDGVLSMSECNGSFGRVQQKRHIVLQQNSAATPQIEFFFPFEYPSHEGEAVPDRRRGRGGRVRGPPGTRRRREGRRRSRGGVRSEKHRCLRSGHRQRTRKKKITGKTMYPAVICDMQEQLSIRRRCCCPMGPAQM